MKLNLIQIYDPGLALRHRIYTHSVGFAASFSEEVAERVVVVNLAGSDNGIDGSKLAFPRFVAGRTTSQ